MTRESRQAGRRGRATSSRTAGAQDPRWDRNARAMAGSRDWDQSMDRNADGQWGVRFREGQPFVKGPDGVRLNMGNGLRLVGGRLELDRDVFAAGQFERDRNGNIQLRRAAPVEDLVDNSTGTSGGGTIAAVTSVATAADAIATLAAKITELQQALRDVKHLKEGSAI